MKRKILLTILIALAAVCLLAFAGCNKEEEKPEAPSYTIQYHDGTQNLTISVKDGDLYNIPVPEKKGYNFLGLFNAREGGLQYVDENGSCLMPFSGSSNMVLFAQFEAKTYTVVFDYDKADNDPYTCTVAYGEALPMPPAPSYVYGSEFVGWYTNKNMAGTRISSASAMDYEKGILSYENFALDNLTGGKLILYAGFKLNEYEIKFYSADGRELITAKKIQHGTDISKIGLITYNDMTVLEWGRTVKGTPVTGEITDEMTLYAVAYSISIVFDSNGGNAVSLGDKRVGSYALLPVPVREYYRFVCWTEDGEPVDNNYLVSDKKVTLVAKWERTHFEVSYNTNGGGGVPSEMVERGNSVSLPLLTKTYYKFNGWAYEGEIVDDGFVMPEKDITLTAQWERTHFEVSYNTDGGSAVNSSMIEKGNSVPLRSTTKTYYKFNGWAYEGEIVDGGFVMPEKDIILTAQWERTHFEVNYITDNNETVPSAMVERGSAVSLPALTKTYYKFNGWAYAGEIVDGSFVMPESNITLTAQWERTHFTLTYSTNGGSSVAVPSLIVCKGESVTLPTTSKKFYKLAGWQYAGKTYTGNFTMPASDANLTAQWEKEFKDYTYVSTAQDFLNIKNNVNGKYMLIADINLSSVQRESVSVFGGELIGNNYTIELGNRVNTVNLQSSETIYYGWFAGINTGKLSDFTVKNLLVKSSQEYNSSTHMAFIGGICGWNNGSGTISNVNIVNSVSGSATKTDAQIICARNRSACGGICGTNGGAIINCSVNALVFGEGDTGGITGQTDARVENCKFTGKIGIYVELDNGNVSLHSWGGIVGFGNSTSSIKDCTVTSCAFEYYGENASCHKTNIFGTHTNCSLDIFVGIICGANNSEANLSGNKYNSCGKDLVLKGGNNHYGSHEKSRLFSMLDGMLGGIAG